MRPFLRLVTPALLVVLATPVAAQYLRITTDNPTDNTRLRVGGTTLLTITLNTNHDKNNAVQTCNSHTSANCSAPATAQPLDMFGYTLALKAVGGTVTWGAFSPSDAAYTDSSPQISSSMEVEINQFRPTGTFTAPGLATLGTIPVTPLTGTPAIQLQIGPGALNPFGFGTGFATTCDGFFFPNFYVVGDPLDPCGTTNGIAGDWFDWDGAGVIINDDTPPSIIAPPTASAAEGAPMATITATATDADATNTLTMTQVGMPSDLTFTTNSPGTSPRTASVSGTPGFTDAGSYNIVWTVNDGTGGLSATRSTTTALTIANTNRAPVLNPVSNMTICDGATADQVVSGSDADGDALTFSKVAGPIFMTVSTLSPTTGNIHLAPPLLSFPGTFPATVRASDGGFAVADRGFTVTIPDCDRAPTLNQPANMTLKWQTTADQALSGSDPFGAPLTFLKVAGPNFMAVSTTSPTTGNVHLAPSFGDVGTYVATVRATSGSFSNEKSFMITVNNGSAPVLNPIANMVIPEGDTQDQAISGSDADGDPLSFSKDSGPIFMTVESISITTGNVHLAPNFTSAGSYSASVRAYDGFLSDTKGFTITVLCLGCRPPVLNPLSDMWVPPGGTQDQAVSGSDPDGDALTFSKDAGPSFMTVTTTSPTTGNIHLAPPPGTTGAPPVGRVAASDGVLSVTQSFFIHLCPCPQPILAPVADITVNEGMTADRTISATDPSGNPLEFFKGVGPSFMTVTTTSSGSTASGNIHLAPGPGDAGTYIASVRASEGLVFVEQTFTITVRSANRCPTATPGGPYAGPAGVPVNFDGSASSDPDGNPLTYAWDFDASNGITVDATGPTPSHSYASAGTFTVTLTVTDNGDGNPAQICSDSDTATATIAAACDATVFNGYDTIRLGSGKPTWFAYVQPTSDCYASSDVVISTFVMKYAGRQISASGKTSVGGDKSGDGIQEIKISFSKDDLRALFSGTGLPNGHNDVTVTLEATLTSGGKVIGTTHLDVVNNGSFTIAEIAPNPLNPEATLTFFTGRQGSVRIDMFDVQGRLVRRLVDDPAMAAGIHTATIDGRGSRGEKLPSGIYYIRGTSSEGEFKRLITILK